MIKNPPSSHKGYCDCNTIIQSSMHGSFWGSDEQEEHRKKHRKYFWKIRKKQISSYADKNNNTFKTWVLLNGNIGKGVSLYLLSNQIKKWICVLCFYCTIPYFECLKWTNKSNETFCCTIRQSKTCTTINPFTVEQRGRGFTWGFSSIASLLDLQTSGLNSVLRRKGFLH